MPKTHGDYTRIELDLRNAGGPLADVETCLALLLELIKQNRMTVRVITKDSYGDGEVGYILVLTLAESFVLIETWPEVLSVKIIVDLCHYQRDNTDLCRAIAAGLKKVFQPQNGTLRVHRETETHIVGEELPA